MPQTVLVDPTRVSPSKHSLFIRGFPGSVDVDDIREFFSKRANSECKVDFSSLSEDKQHLFVAIRFQSHGVAKKIFTKYDGERIFGHKVEMNWFKDIRKATKKAVKNVNNKTTSGKSVNHRRHESIRRRGSSDESSRSRSRSSDRSRNSPESSTRSSRRGSSASSTSSGEIRSRHRSHKAVSQRSGDTSRHRSPSSSSTGSSSSSSSASSSSTRHSYREYPPRASPNKAALDKQMVNAALEANPAHHRSNSVTRSLSHGSSQHTHNDQDHPEVVEHRRVVITKDVPHKLGKEKRKQREIFDQPLIKKPHMTFKPSMMEQPVDIILEDEPSVHNVADDDVHAMLECGEVPLHNIFLPDEQPITDGPQAMPELKSETVTSAPSTMALQPEVNAAQPMIDIQTIPSPDIPLSASKPVEIPPVMVNGEVSHTVNGNGEAPSFDEMKNNSNNTSEIGIQYGTDAAREELNQSLLQLSAVTDNQLDVIFQKKRLIEAAYRLDCESYTTSVAKLIRMNPDLKDRLVSSLRSLLEERAKRSIAELQEHIRSIQPLS